MQLSQLEHYVVKLIPRGSERKISIAEISYTLHIDERATYGVINSLRSKGVPVCAKRAGEPQDRGYYIATNEAELREGIAPYKAQIADMMKLVSILEQADLAGWHETLD